MTTPFWISHHGEDQRMRCVKIGNFDVCARCLGLYPLLFFLLILEGIFHAPGLTLPDVFLLPIATMPALFDWARGRFSPTSGTNRIRIVTGALLAVALSRSLWFHFTTPLHPATVAHLTWIFASAALVELAKAASKKITRTHQNLLSSGPMPLTREEILAGMSLDDIQERYGLPKLCDDAVSTAPKSSIDPEKNSDSSGGYEFSTFTEFTDSTATECPTTQSQKTKPSVDRSPF